MKFIPVNGEDGDMASSEADILNSVGILANSTKSHRSEQINLTSICVCCGEIIPKERQDIFPNCNYCVTCQNERDQLTGAKSNRPFLNLTPQSIFENKSGGDEFESEDEDGSLKKELPEKDDLPADLNHVIKVHRRDNAIPD